MKRSDLYRTGFHSLLFDAVPSVQWRGLAGSTTTLWEHVIGPHPEFKGYPPQKWVVTRKGNLVESERHDPPESDGRLPRFHLRADLSLSGNIVETHGKSSSDESRYQAEWAPHGDVHILKRWTVERSFTRYQPQREEWKLLSFRDSLPPDAPPLEVSSLRIRDRAPVDDRITKRKYTYKAARITQEDLDRVIKQSQSQKAKTP